MKMGSKTVILITIQFALFNVAYPQSLNRILPNCGLNGLPITETLLPNFVRNQLNYLPYDLPYEILPNTMPLPNVLQPLPRSLQPLPNVVQQLPNVLPALPALAPTIIQENTVASNLANALQLLVVSNLLRNTLPQAADVGVPGYPFEYGSQAPYGYNYIY